MKDENGTHLYQEYEDIKWAVEQAELALLSGYGTSYTIYDSTGKEVTRSRK